MTHPLFSVLSLVLVALLAKPAPAQTASLVLHLGPVQATLPAAQGWVLAAQTGDFVTATRIPQPGHSHELSLVWHPVTDPAERLLLLKRPREATQPYLQALRDDLDSPAFPEVYFEAFPWATAGQQCQFFQAISDESAAVPPSATQRVIRSLGAVCGLPAYGAVLEMRLLAVQPLPTDNYLDINADAEGIFETIAID
ncbi:MAG: hypothetical protein Kow0013_01630 [Pararhodobacter sp.]